MSPLDWGNRDNMGLSPAGSTAGMMYQSPTPRNEWQRQKMGEIFRDPSLSVTQAQWAESAVTAGPGTWLNPGKKYKGDPGTEGNPSAVPNDLTPSTSAMGWSALRRGF
jgi:hypothetical protein